MASRIYFVLALAVSAAARPRNISSVITEQGEPDGNIDLNSPLYLDDMRFVDGQLDQVKTAAIPHEQLRWRGATVPYEIDSSVAGYLNLIQQAMMDYHTKTCIRFVPRTIQANYIRIFAGQGCYSNVGMIGGQQPISLGQGCMFKGTIVHELGHAIGFFHEQNRSDRDDYLIIYWQNIQQGMESQFDLLKPHENLLLGQFDYNSIMLYGNTAFSKDGRSNTMVAKSGVPLLETYDKPGLTASDANAVNRMYNCAK